MAKMCEGFTRLVTGKDAFSRNLSLFSICGIVGLLQGYIMLTETDIVWKYILTAVSLIFTMFLTGYEILFLNERETPDIDLRPFKLMIKKVPLIVFLVCIPLTLTSLFTKYQNPAFLTEAILAVPLTMIQAGFSYKFDDKDWNLVFKKFKISDYILLFIKRIWIIILAYATTFTTIFCVFFVIVVAAAIVYRGDLTTVAFAISSKEYAIKAISTYMTGVLMVYMLTLGTLIWDYELVKTYEREEK